MAQIYVISFSSHSNVPESVAALQIEVVGLLKRKCSRGLVYSSATPACMDFAARLSQELGTSVKLCPALEEMPFKEVQASYAHLHIKADPEPRSFYALAHRVMQKGKSCVFFASPHILGQINPKDLVHMKSVKEAVVICQLSCKNLASRLIESDPGISACMNQRLALSQSLRQSFLSFSTIRQSTQNLGLVSKLQEQVKELASRSQSVMKPNTTDAQALQPRIEGLMTLVQKASSLYRSVNTKLKELCDRADCYIQGNWNGADYLDIVEFKVASDKDTWELRVRNCTESTFLDVHFFIWESQMAVSTLSIVEPKTTVTFTLPLTYTPELYCQHIFAQSQGRQASKLFPISPIKIVSVKYGGGNRMDIELLNLALEPQAGLAVVSPDFVQPLTIGQTLQYNMPYIAQLSFPIHIASGQNLELLIIKKKQLVSRPYLWLVPEQTVLMTSDRSADSSSKAVAPPLLMPVGPQQPVLKPPLSQNKLPNISPGGPAQVKPQQLVPNILTDSPLPSIGSPASSKPTQAPFSHIVSPGPTGQVNPVPFLGARPPLLPGSAPVGQSKPPLLIQAGGPTPYSPESNLQQRPVPMIGQGAEKPSFAAPGPLGGGNETVPIIGRPGASTNSPFAPTAPSGALPDIQSSAHASMSSQQSNPLGQGGTSPFAGAKLGLPSLLGPGASPFGSSGSSNPPPFTKQGPN